MKEKTRIMIKVLAFAVVGAAMFVLTGCDPEKIGGGGHLQPYSGATGQYK